MGTSDEHKKPEFRCSAALKKQKVFQKPVRSQGSKGIDPSLGENDRADSK